MNDFNRDLFLQINGMAGGSELLDGLVRLFANDYFVPTSLSILLLSVWFAGSDADQRHRHQRAVLAAPLAVLLVNLAVSYSNSAGITGTRPFMDYARAVETARALFYLPPDPSFPSNSAAVAFVLGGLLFWANRRVGLLGLGLASGIGFARVYAGVHYPLDVVAGAVLGLVGAMAAIGIMRIFDPVPSFLLRVGRRLFLA